MDATLLSEFIQRAIPALPAEKLLRLARYLLDEFEIESIEDMACLTKDDLVEYLSFLQSRKFLSYIKSAIECEILETLEHVNAFTNDKVQLCIVISKPRDITWLKNGEPVSSKERYFIEISDGGIKQTLTIEDVSQEDNGEYTAEVKNKSSVVKTSCKLSVRDKLKDIPHSELNILLLGVTGVGKSTFVNGFANYLTYSTLEEAQENVPISLIPTTFTMTDANYKQQTITTGNHKNENYDTPGQSATMYPKTYVFKIQSATVRLIDTPGIGDTRGVEQDKENFQHTLDHIANFECLHGICILLRPNDSRLNIMFQYCINELLTHLHKDASRNIVFCFTNSRGTFYMPGETMTPLQELIVQSCKDNVDIKLCQETMYCFDNESLRFLAASHVDIQFPDDQFADFSKSWARSVSETERLMQHIINLTPHKIRNTLSINDTRRMIVALARPLAEMVTNIQDNINISAAKQQELYDSTIAKGDFAKQLYVPRIEIQILQLKHTVKVCESEKCAKEVMENKQTRTTYSCTQPAKPFIIQKLHDIVHDKKSEPCKRCECSKQLHRKLTHETIKIEKEVVDERIQKQVDDIEAESLKIAEALIALEERVKELEKEQTQLTEYSAQFACFLKKNAITLHNDAFEDYLDYFVQKQGKNKKGSKQAVTNDDIRRIRKMYGDQKKTLMKALDDPKNIAQAITERDIERMINEIYTMKSVGKQLKDVIKHAEVADSNAQERTQIIVEQHRQKQDRPSVLQKLFLKKSFIKSSGTPDTHEDLNTDVKRELGGAAGGLSREEMKEAKHGGTTQVKDSEKVAKEVREIKKKQELDEQIRRQKEYDNRKREVDNSKRKSGYLASWFGYGN